MKLKVTIPSINKNLFFSLGFVLFASILLLINWLFGLPVQQAQKIHQQLIATENKLVRLKSLKADFLLQYENGEELLSDEGYTEKEVRAIIDNFRNELQHYSSFRIFARNQDIQSSLADMTGLLETTEGNLFDFILATRERGNKNSGLIAQWQGLSTRMMLPLRSDEALKKDMELIKSLENKYLLTKDIYLLEEISALAQEIHGKLSPVEGGVSSADVDSYLAITASLISVDKRIGNLNIQGMAADVNQGIEKLLELNKITGQLMNDVIAGVRMKWSFAKYAILILFTVTCIFILISITSLGILRPLKETSDSISRLAQGELAVVPVGMTALREIRQISDLLSGLLSGLKEKAGFARSLNEGVLTAQLNPGDKDILGKELVQLQHKMRETAENQQKTDEENMKRRYINEGLAKFADILRARSNDISLLGDSFIREMVKYLGAIQGGFFLLNTSDPSTPVLELVSAFAYNRKKYLQQSLALGEGLVGTCAREKQPIHLTEIPAGYISITSGLGDTQPDNLLLVPVLHEEELIGVLEIASLKKYKEHEIKFVMEVAGNLGATIIYTRNNDRTSRLLERSQHQAQEMAEQEEEMRQNMEELKATQEESARREEELRGIAEAVGNSMFVIEYDLDGIIRNVNDKCCIFLGLTRDDVLGKQHQEVFGGELITDSGFWEELQKNMHTLVTENVKLGKMEYRLQEHFSCVLNRDGLVVKFICFIIQHD